MIALVFLVALAQVPAVPSSTGEAPASPAPSPAPTRRGTEDGWQDYDRVLLVINDDILTFKQMFRRFQEHAREGNVRTQEGQRRLWFELRVRATRMQVAIQAGEGMGFDQALIDHHAREDFRRIVHSAGGVVEMTKLLEQEDLTAEELKERKRDAIYAGLWEEAVTGRGVSVSARQSRDRYVRPGLLRFEHELALSKPGALGRIGGRDDEFELQHLFVDVSDFDRPERARELAAQLRSRIVDGEVMSDLIRKYDPMSPDDGALPRSTRATLERVFPTVGAFLKSAKQGDVSDVTEVDTGRRKGFVVFRLNDKTSAEVPDLAAPEAQKKLRDVLQRELDDSRIEAAMRSAIEGSYVWMGELPKAN